MKKIIVSLAVMLPLLLAQCSQVGKSVVYSDSNFEEGVTLEAPQLGPNSATIDVSAVEPLAEADSLIESNIPANTTAPIGNMPVELSLSADFDTSGVNISNSYLLNKNGQVIYARLAKFSDNSLLLIPQIRLQPNSNYTAVFGGILNADNQAIGPVKVPFRTPDLDFGLYFFGKNGLCEKYFPGIDNAFYDASKKTVVFAHGWQSGATTMVDEYGRQNFRHEIFYWSEDSFNGAKSHNGLRQFTNHAWVDKGYNTGIVYWNQFADEPAGQEGNGLGVFAAEAKIWSFDGPRGSRYRTIDNAGNAVYRNFNKTISFDGQSISVNSVGDILGRIVSHALALNTSGTIRLVGHSLGNQVVHNLAYSLYQNNVRVNRIALLDPAWTNNPKDYLPVITSADASVYSPTGQRAVATGSVGRRFWVGEKCRLILFTLLNAWGKSNLSVASYHATALDVGIPVMDANKALTREIAEIHNRPWYYNAFQIGPKHVSSRHNYFWSMASTAPAEVTIGWFNSRNKTGRVAGSAATPHWRINEMMGPSNKWNQVEGRFTPDPADDWFELKNK